jgi:hypothetical protein
MQAQRALSENGRRVLEAAVRRFETVPANSATLIRGESHDNGWDNWDQWPDGDWGNGVDAPWQN